MGCNTEEERKPAADEILSKAVYLAERMTSLQDRFFEKLASVMITERPASIGTGGKELTREYPPLFAQLRDNFTVIESVIANLNEALNNRVEL